MKRAFLPLYLMLLLLFTGCAQMTMPKANQALGQLRIGNEQRAWELIDAERQGPGVSTKVELCEMHGITVQILQQIINKSYLPADKEAIGKHSYAYVANNCRDFIRIVAITEHNYGRMLMTLGRPGEALPHMKEAMRYVQRGSFDHVMKEDALADIYASLGKPELRDYHRINALATANVYFGKPRTYRWNTDEFNEWSGYGKVLHDRLYDLATADEPDLGQMNHYWKQLQSIASRWSGNETKYFIYTKVSQIYAEAGDTAFAWQLHKRAEQLVAQHTRKFRTKALADLQMSKAQILKAEGRYPQAADTVHTWIKQHTAAYGKPPGGNAYRLAGNIHELAGRYDLAITYLTKSISGIETMRDSFDVGMRESMLGGKVATAYWSLARSYAKRYEASRSDTDFMGALRTARMLRGRQFGELLGIGYQHDQQQDIDTLHLEHDEMLVSFLLTDTAIVTFTITPRSRMLHYTPYDARQFDEQVQILRAQLSEPGTDHYLDTLAKLSRVLADTLESIPSLTQNLIIIPDGSLNAVPPGLLSKRHDRYRPLLMDHTIILTPSLSYFIAQRNTTAPATSQKLFAVADPRFGTRALPRVHQDETRSFYTRAVDAFGLFAPLPETRTEVKQIARHFQANDTALAFGAEATESMVKAHPLSTYRYLHFATHGILSDQVPGIDQPALVLAAEASSNEDGFLTMKEVETLKLHSELTVLSACDTGSGKYFTGEGVMGLSRSFLVAGSRSVIVSLWPVSSKATVELMDRFYTHLMAGRSKALSLKAAQLEMMQGKISSGAVQRGLKRTSSHSASMSNTVHPFYWAPFVLIGE
jgi:CHAT domain-containing protein